MQISINDRGQAFTRDNPTAIWQHYLVRRVEHLSIGDARGVAALYREDRTTPGGMRDVAYLAIERDGTHSLYSKPDRDCGLIREDGTWADQDLALALGDSAPDAGGPEGKPAPPAAYGQQIWYGLRP